MRSNTWVEPHAVNDVLCIQALHLSAGVEFVKIANTKSQICIGKEIDCSASVKSMNSVSISGFNSPSWSKRANYSAASRISSSQPTMIREGYKLSYSALDSRRNSGLKRMLWLPVFALICRVYPTGIVDLITMMASGLTDSTISITDSTADVSKKFFCGS